MTVTVVGGVAYAVSLVPADAGLHDVIVASCIAAALVAVSTLSHSLVGDRHHGRDRDPDRERRWGLALSAAALLLGAAWASGTAVAAELGPFDSPYQPAAQTAAEHIGWSAEVSTWPQKAARAAAVPADRSIETAGTSAQVSEDVLATGHEFLPVGGFTGQVPATSVGQLRADIRSGRVEHVLVSVAPRTRNPAMRWVGTHCRGGNLVHQDGATYRRYVCLPADVNP